MLGYSRQNANHRVTPEYWSYSDLPLKVSTHTQCNKSLCLLKNNYVFLLSLEVK